ncbi:MAG: response regulator [Deltaproteobacteria bacterium]|nr:response regulator [Deltaproteobacteria bacterium]
MKFILDVLQNSGALMGVVTGLLIIAMVSAIKFLNMKKKLKEKEKTLGKARKKCRQVIDNTDEGIIIGKEFKFKFANKKACEIMGLSQGGDISGSLLDYIHPDDLNTMLDGYEKPMKPGNRKISFKLRLIKKDKSILWVHVRSIKVFWDDEPAELFFIKDITALKMMEQDLQQAQRMEAIGALSGGIAHDFNNILTTIIGNAEVALLDLSGQEPGKSEFEQIRESGYRARDLVRQILSISRQNAMDVQPLYLSPIIKEALKLLRSTLPKNIEIVENIDQKLDMVRADSIQMYQVFMNLCTNAKHAMEKEESPCLEVGLENVTLRSSGKEVSNNLKPGRYVKLSVRDNGIGIDPGIKDKIFKPYFTTKESVAGSGLGLATSLGIVKRFCGHLTFESENGKGACFIVYLPAYEMEEPSNGFVPEKNAPVKGEGKILFVDDEKEITIVSKKMLENIGFSVMAVNSGREALEYFARSPDFFDLMFTDMAMPEMTGEKLAKEVLRIRPGFPVIMCTGHSDTFDETKAKESGIMEYITKPYNLNILSVIALKYIKKSKAA